MSSVLGFPPALPQQSVAYLQAKLAYYTDAWDLADDLAHQRQGIVVIDARQVEAWRAGHISGAVNFLIGKSMKPARLLWIATCSM